jgi:folate-binding Fe-S cluster repair protein YgfZ
MSRYLVAPLSSTRSLLSLHGADAAKFLQGLVSNNVGSSNTASILDRAVYAGVFSAQGRLLHDTFILRDPSIPGSDGNGFIVDYPSRVTQPSLLPHLKRFILRSKVKARDINPDWRLWAVFQDPLDRSQPKTTIEEEVQHIASTSKGRWWRDCRNSRMGYRLLLPPSASPAIECE